MKGKKIGKERTQEQRRDRRWCLVYNKEKEKKVRLVTNWYNERVGVKCDRDLIDVEWKWDREWIEEIRDLTCLVAIYKLDLKTLNEEKVLILES